MKELEAGRKAFYTSPVGNSIWWIILFLLALGFLLMQAGESNFDAISPYIGLAAICFFIFLVFIKPLFNHPSVIVDKEGISTSSFRLRWGEMDSVSKVPIVYVYANEYGGELGPESEPSVYLVFHVNDASKFPSGYFNYLSDSVWREAEYFRCRVSDFDYEELKLLEEEIQKYKPLANEITRRQIRRRVRSRSSRNRF